MTMTRDDRCQVIRFGTRGSGLALAQTARVIGRLAGVAPDVAAATIAIRTEGDDDKTSPLTVIGGRGVFTSALQEALRRGDIDAAVHSAKDLPAGEPADLALVAFPEREDARDVLVSRHRRPLAELAARPVIGTSSRRRAVQVRLRRPDARIVDLRGNVDTRLRKALATELDAIVLAAAGVRRMGFDEQITEMLPLDGFVPSPGQGALAVEVRAGDAPLVALLGALDDPLVATCVRAERAFLRALGVGCTSPVGAYVEPADGRLRLRAMLASPDGERVAWADERLPVAAAEAVAAEIAGRLAEQVGGAGRGSGRDAPPAPPNGKAISARTSDRPLLGLRVLVTRARSQAAPWSAALREQGAEPVELPTIRIEDPIDPAPLDAALGRLPDGAYDWVVFTSANAVDRVVARLDRLGLGRAALDRAGVAAVGAATAAALRAAGVAVDVVPERAIAEAVVAALGGGGRSVAGRRVLYPRSDVARDTLPDGLRALGAAVDAVEAYRTVAERAVDPAVRARIAGGEIDVATFASPSSVRALVALLGPDLGGLRGAAIVCVGPVTAAAACAAGLAVDAVADDATAAGMVAAVVRQRTGTPAAVVRGGAADRLVASGGVEAGRPWERMRGDGRPG